MGFPAQISVMVNVYLIMPGILLWIICHGILLMSTGAVTCSCSSTNETACDLITKMCLLRDFDAVPYGTPVTLKEEIIPSARSNRPVELTHFVLEDGNEIPVTYRYFFRPQFLLWCMLLHLLFLIYQTLLLLPFYDVVEFAEQLQNKYYRYRNHNRRRRALEEMRSLVRQQTKEHRQFGGRQIFKLKLMSFALACVQIVFIAFYMYDDLGSRQLISFLSGKIRAEQFLYNEFPQMANCRLDATFLPNNSNPHVIPVKSFNANVNENVQSACYFPTNAPNRLLYSFLYLWLHILCALFTLRLCASVLVMYFRSVRKAIFRVWARFYECNLSPLVYQQVSAVELVYLLQLRDLIERRHFADFIQIFSEEVNRDELIMETI